MVRAGSRFVKGNSSFLAASIENCQMTHSMLSCAHAFCPGRRSLLLGRTVKDMGALPVVTTAQAPGGRSRVQAAGTDPDVDGAVGDDSGGGEGDGDDDESSVAAPHGKLAEPAASKTSRPSCRARRVIFLII